MTHIEQAIKEAVEKGGYDNRWGLSISSERAMFLDPSFWQALGKARGWEQSDYSCSFGSQHPTLLVEFRGMAYATGSWRDVWHRFIDHRADGKDAESFFEALIV